MRHLAKVSLCFAVICLAAGGAPVAAQDGEAVPEITISPLNGGPGTEIQVSGSGCPPAGWDDEGELDWTVHVRSDGTDSDGSIQPPSEDDTETPIVFTADEPLPLGGASTTPDDAGNWSMTLTVQDVPDTTGEYLITATCVAEFVEQGVLTYATPHLFEVLAEEPPPPPTPEPEPAPEPAPSEPRFTG